MKTRELKTKRESLIETFAEAGKISIDLYKKGLKIEIKEDNSPVSNGDLKVNELITNKIKNITIKTSTKAFIRCYYNKKFTLNISLFK